MLLSLRESGTEEGVRSAASFCCWFHLSLSVCVCVCVSLSPAPRQGVV